MQISKNFYLYELLASETAVRMDYKEQFNPPQPIINHLIDLCNNILQPLRDYILTPIRITSGYRCERLNKRVGGAKNSDHQFGMAADIKGTNGHTNRDLFMAAIGLNLPFDQLIAEYPNSQGEPDWVHISYNPERNRKQILVARKINGKTVYQPYKHDTKY